VLTLLDAPIAVCAQPPRAPLPRFDAHATAFQLGDGFQGEASIAAQMVQPVLDPTERGN